MQQARRRQRRAYRLAENDHLSEAIRMAVQAKDGFLTATRGNRRWMDEYAAFLITVSDLRLAQVDLRAANDDLNQLVQLYEADGNEPVDDERVDQLADALTRRGNCLRLRAEYPRADIDLARARQLARSPLVLAGAHNASGILAKDRGRLDDAGEHYAIALNTLVKLFGEDDSRLADVQHNLAGLQHARRAYTEGEQFARRAITLRTKAHGADSTEVAADMAVLGALLLGQQRFDEAEHLFEQTCDCWTRHRGPEQPVRDDDRVAPVGLRESTCAHHPASSRQHEGLTPAPVCGAHLIGARVIVRIWAVSFVSAARRPTPRGPGSSLYLRNAPLTTPDTRAGTASRTTDRRK